MHQDNCQGWQEPVRPASVRTSTGPHLVAVHDGGGVHVCCSAECPEGSPSTLLAGDRPTEEYGSSENQSWGTRVETIQLIRNYWARTWTLDMPPPPSPPPRLLASFCLPAGPRKRRTAAHASIVCSDAYGEGCCHPPRTGRQLLLHRPSATRSSPASALIYIRRDPTAGCRMVPSCPCVPYPYACAALDIHTKRALVSALACRDSLKNYGTAAYRALIVHLLD